MSIDVEQQIRASDFFILLIRMYGEDNVGYKPMSEKDLRGIWVTGLSYYPITKESILYDRKFVTDMDAWLHSNYVMYATPRASGDEYRISFQMFPPGKFKKSYFDVKHNGTYDSIIRAKFEAAIRLANMSVHKREEEVDDV